MIKIERKKEKKYLIQMESEKKIIEGDAMNSFISEKSTYGKTWA
jgi:hypothetical protein